MVLTLGFIQLIGRIIFKLAGVRLGFLISGFINGLVSSTAFTASLSRKSKSLSLDQIKMESVSFLSATLAMLVQGLVLILIGLSDPPLSAIAVFMGPIFMSVFLIAIRHQKTRSIKPYLQEGPAIEFISLLKLAIFIVGIIAISKFLQLRFGGRGIEILTFLVSLFEIHGSVIANTQLMAKQDISANEFCFLLSLSIAASYIGKAIIVLVLGHSYFKKRVLIWSGLLLVSIAVSSQFWIY